MCKVENDGKLDGKGLEGVLWDFEGAERGGVDDNNDYA